jgi:GNAT superfamily N-acetyltransferase
MGKIQKDKRSYKNFKNWTTKQLEQVVKHPYNQGIDGADYGPYIEEIMPVYHERMNRMADKQYQDFSQNMPQNELPSSAEEVIHAPEDEGDVMDIWDAPQTGSKFRFGKSEDLEKGMRGDWEKEGYTVEHSGEVDYEGADDGEAESYLQNNPHLRPHDFHAYSPSGEVIGTLRVAPHSKYTNNIYAMDVNVEPDHRRKGVASALYRLAEKKFGKKMLMGVTGLSNDSKNLWANPNRPFGKSENLEKGMKGDWEKEGYTLQHEVQEADHLTPNVNWHKVKAFDSNGKLAGVYSFAEKLVSGAGKSNMPDFYPASARTQEAHRRKGLASAAYKLIQEKTGKKLQPSPLQTKDAERVWANPNRGFGKSENDLFKAPMLLNQESSDNIGSSFSGQPEPRHVKGHIGSYKRKDGMYHHIIEDAHGANSHFLSTSADPWDSKGSVARIDGEPSKDGFTVYHSSVRKDHAGKGLGKQLYLGVLAHHGNIQSDSALSRRSHNAWKALPELSSGLVNVKLGDLMDKQSRHSASADKTKLQGMLYDKRIAPKNNKLAASESIDSDLNKGSLQQRIGNPKKEVSEEEKFYTENWVENANRVARPMIPKATSKAKQRFFQKLHSQTEVRKHPKTGERMFLMHRGGSVDESTGGLHGSETTSWTPNIGIAREFASGPDSKLFSAWIPEKAVVNYVNNAVETESQPRLWYEHEYIVAPHDFIYATKKKLSPKQLVDKKINTRQKITSGQKASLQLPQTREEVKKINKIKLPRQEKLAASESIDSDLNKSKNVREQRKKIFGTDANAPRISEKRRKMMNRIRDHVKRNYGMDLEIAQGKKDEHGNLRKIPKPSHQPFDVFTEEGAKKEAQRLKSLKQKNIKRVDPKPDWVGSTLETQPNPDAAIHEVAHLRLAPEGRTPEQFQSDMDLAYADHGKKYGHAQGKRTSWEVQPMSIENPIRRELGLPSNKSAKTPISEKTLKQTNKKRAARGLPPIEIDAETGSELNFDDKRFRFHRGTNNKFYDRQSRLQSPETQDRMTQIREGSLKFHPTKGWHKADSSDALINLRGRGQKEEATARLKNKYRLPRQEKLAASEKENNDLMKAPQLMDQDEDFANSVIDNYSFNPKNHEIHKTYKLKDGKYYHIYNEPHTDDMKIHAISDHKEPFKKPLSVLATNQDFTPDGYQRTVAQTTGTDPLHQGQGHGTRLKKLAAKFHGKLYSDGIISEREHKSWQKLKENKNFKTKISPTQYDMADKKGGEHYDYNEDALEQRHVVKYKKPSKLAASEGVENNLFKGSFQSRNKARISPEEIENTKIWVNATSNSDQEPRAFHRKIREKLQQPSETLNRLKQKLPKQTQVKRHPETGELMVLLHRGMSGEEFDSYVKDKNINHDRSTSWTPNKAIASTFVFGDRSKKLVSAWVPFSKIKSAPFLTPDKDQKNGLERGSIFVKAPRSENEIIVAPNHNSLIAEENIEPKKDTLGERVRQYKVNSWNRSMIQNQKLAASEGIENSLNKASLPYSNWRHNSSEDIENEYNWEYKNRWKNSGLFPTANHFHDAVKNAKIVQVTPEMDENIHNRSRTESIEELKDLVSGYRFPRDVDRIVRGFQNNDAIPHPIVIKQNGRYTVMSGNTRMDAARLHGINPHVAIVDMDEQKNKPNINKALTAGSPVGAPSTLTGGEALQKESLDKAFASQAQRRFAYANKKKFGGKEGLKEWESKTPKNIPKKVQKTKKSQNYTQKGIKENYTDISIKKAMDSKKLGRFWFETTYANMFPPTKGELDYYKKMIESHHIGNWALKKIPVNQIEGHHFGHDKSDEYIKEYSDMKRQGSDYPALIIKPHPEKEGMYETIDGQHRLLSAKKLGESHIYAYVPENNSNNKYRFKKSEELKKGLKGDWKKEGYKIKVNHEDSPVHTGPRISAMKNGREVGFARINSDGKHIVANDTYVDKKHRRKGLATAMYSHAEKSLKRKFKPAKLQTEEGRKLWSSFKKSEKLEKGLKGDWKKEGYTFHKEPHLVDLNTDLFWNEDHPDFNDENYSPELAHIVVAKTKDGEHVGEFSYEGNDNSFLHPRNVKVYNEHRRKGIASGMYQFAEKLHNSKIAPTAPQTADGKALWNQPNRPFGKSENNPLELEHYSHVQGLKQIDPNQARTGVDQSSRSNQYRNKISFYYPKGYQNPEHVVTSRAKSKYTTKLNPEHKIWDIKTHGADLINQIKQSNQGALDMDMFMDKLKEQGFHGFKTRPQGLEMVAMFHPLDVAHEEKIGYNNDMKKSEIKPKSPFNVRINPEHGKTIADAYEQMKHDPEHPEVKAAYGALINETKKQYQDLLRQGYRFTKITDPNFIPYKNSEDMHNDIEQNKHLYYFPTSMGFGSEEDKIPEDHPMLATTEFNSHDNQPMAANDVFRQVHDIAGHFLGGRTKFGAKGEHQAYLHHKNMYSEAAHPALAAETLMQNQYVNFGPNAEHNKKNPNNTKFAPQKAGLVSKEIWQGKWHE